jgi:hypothetical protein
MGNKRSSLTNELLFVIPNADITLIIQKYIIRICDYPFVKSFPRDLRNNVHVEKSIKFEECFGRYTFETQKFTLEHPYENYQSGLGSPQDDLDYLAYFNTKRIMINHSIITGKFEIGHFYDDPVSVCKIYLDTNKRSYVILCIDRCLKYYDGYFFNPRTHRFYQDHLKWCSHKFISGNATYPEKTDIPGYVRLFIRHG